MRRKYVEGPKAQDTYNFEKRKVCYYVPLLRSVSRVFLSMQLNANHYISTVPEAKILSLNNDICQW